MMIEYHDEMNMLVEAEELEVKTIAHLANYNDHRHLETLILLAVIDGDDYLRGMLNDVVGEELI